MELSDLIARRKLALAFWVMVVASAASAASAILALSLVIGIEGKLRHIVQDNNVQIDLNRELSRAVYIVSSGIPRLALANSPAELSAQQARILQAREGYDAAWARLQALPASEASQRLSAAIQAAGQRTRQLNDQLIALALQPGDSAQAAASLRVRASAAAEAWQAAIDERIAFEQADSAASYAAAESGYFRARALLIALGLGSVGLGLLFGWMSRRALTDLSRTLKERDDLIGMLAHEVAQPLNKASAAIEAAMALIAAQERADSAATVAPLVRAQSVLGHVVGSLNNTMAAARLVADEREIMVQDSDIDTVIGLALGDLDPELRDRVHINRIGSARTAAMNDSLVRLAVRNLLANALTYSPAGSRVDLDILDSDDPLALVLEVRDWGGGIPATLLPRLFERGVRGPQQGAVPGMGLGLFIVSRVVALHRGVVDVRGNQPVGTVFRIVLPQGVFA